MRDALMCALLSFDQALSTSRVGVWPPPLSMLSRSDAVRSKSCLSSSEAIVVTDEREVRPVDVVDSVVDAAVMEDTEDVRDDDPSVDVNGCAAGERAAEPIGVD